MKPYRLGALYCYGDNWPDVERLREEITENVNDLGVYKMGDFTFFNNGLIQHFGEDYHNNPNGWIPYKLSKLITSELR